MLVYLIDTVKRPLRVANHMTEKSLRSFSKSPTAEVQAGIQFAAGHMRRPSPR